MVDIRARNFENALPRLDFNSNSLVPGMTQRSVTVTVRTVYQAPNGGNPKMKRNRPADTPKMGRPRTDDKVVRKSKGTRLPPALIVAVEAAIKGGLLPGVRNFNEAVEEGLRRLVKFKPKTAP